MPDPHNLYLSGWHISAGEQQHGRDLITSISPQMGKEHHFPQLIAGERGNQFIWSLVAKMTTMSPKNAARYPPAMHYC